MAYTLRIKEYVLVDISRGVSRKFSKCLVLMIVQFIYLNLKTFNKLLI